MNSLRRFLYGRNGVDQLSRAVLIAGVVLLLIGRIANFPYISFVYWLCMFIFFFRTLSRDIMKRRAENEKYLAMTENIRGWFRLRVRMARESKEYVYLKCPCCMQRIRAPRGKGRIKIACQRCSYSFEKKV